jgi:hypothetical protein
VTDPDSVDLPLLCAAIDSREQLGQLFGRPRQIALDDDFI